MVATLDSGYGACNYMGQVPVPGSREERIALLREAAARDAPVLTPEALQEAQEAGAMTVAEIERLAPGPVREAMLERYRAVTGAGRPTWLVPALVIAGLFLLLRR